MKVNIYSNYQDVPSEVIEYVHQNGLVQHYPVLGEAFEGSMYKYYYAVAAKKSEVMGVFPYVVVKEREISIAFSLPYLSYGGICGENKEIISKLLREVEEVLIDEGILTLSWSEYPFESLSSNVEGQYELNNFYQYLELEEAKYKSRTTSKFRNNLRRNLKKAKEYSLIIRRGNNLRDLNEWYVNVYVSRLQETGGAIYPLEVFKALLKVPNQRSIFIIIEKENEIIGGAFCLAQNSVLDLFMRVVSTEYLHTQAGVFLDHYIIENALEQGFKYLNWQSTDAIDSSIYKYKESWGSLTSYHQYRTLKLNDFSKLKGLTVHQLKEEFEGMFIAPYPDLEKYL